MKSNTDARRILHFDIETRLVGFHNGGRWNPGGCEPIAMAWMPVGKAATVVSLRHQWLLKDMIGMLKAFREAYDWADMVTGHYVMKFDLPILSGVMLEFGLPPLEPKWVHDTKCHLFRRQGVSVSQENLSLMLRLEETKLHMADANWREAARLTRAGMKKARDRVVSDVRQHFSLRNELLAGGYLRSPQIWRS